MPIDLKSLRNTKKIKADLAAALEKEARPLIRRRLLALQAVLRGESYRAAARLVGANSNSVSLWVKTVQEEGLAAVLISDVRLRPWKPEIAATVQTEIAAALQRQPRWKIRNRLKGVDAFLSGHSLEAAAALASVRPHTLRACICQIRREGIASTLRKWEALQKRSLPRLKANPAILRARAGRENCRHVRKRLLALAYLAEGLNAEDVAMRVGTSADYVHRYRRRFRQGGLAALRNKPRRGGIPKLKPTELQAVAKRVKQGADNSLSGLGTWITTEFGVVYTPAGLKNMLKKQLGFQGLPP